MKKVRFESPVKTNKFLSMNDSECHSPRPFVDKQVKSAPHLEYLNYQPVSFTNDPVKRYEYGNSSPYPKANRTRLAELVNIQNKVRPSNDLDLSILDSSHMPRKLQQKNLTYSNRHSNLKINGVVERSASVLTPSENQNGQNPPNVLQRNDNFFLRRDNQTGYNQLSSELNKLSLDKENNPYMKKNHIMMMGQSDLPLKRVDNLNFSNSSYVDDNSNCKCHHCIKVCKSQYMQQKVNVAQRQNLSSNKCNACHCIAVLPQNDLQCNCNFQTVKPFVPNCNCNTKSPISPTNAIDKKTWAIQRYEQNKNTECLDIEKQTNITMDKTEPTVADLFKIIKMQSEQLQLLQEKVDKFISSSACKEQRINSPLCNYVTDQVALKSVATEQKISIGVMTSFEVVRTSTFINKEVIKQNEAQIQCNRSQVSVKEVVSKEPVNLNFLDGLDGVKNIDSHQTNRNSGNCEVTHGDFNDDKTLNEISLYNVHVENAITPNISPEQSLYLDIRDYSDSDASSDDQSNVGWTYYNKVMTHVNGMLQESDMPSSASALHRNVRQKCLQLQIDKANVSVAKRVTFGDDPLGLHKPVVQIPSTDTSLKMKQLAAKYLTNGVVSNTPSPGPLEVPLDMSIGTRNYMEKHRLLRGTNMQTAEPQYELPKFLDITALKQQPKFL